MFQPFEYKVEFMYFFDFIFRKIASIHFLQPDFVIRKRISNSNSIISGNQNNALKKLHKFGSGVEIAFADHFKIHLKIGD